MQSSSTRKIVDLANLLNFLEPEQRQDLERAVVTQLPIWTPLVGPQLDAYNSSADILFYGGSAGGAKTDLLLGLALTRHRRSIVFRREATQTVAIVDRLSEILKTRDGYNSQQLIWRLPDRQIEFGSCKDPGDEAKWQGRPHDLLAFDEITNFLEAQFRFLTTWLRTTIPGQRCRIVCTGNPPQTEEGRWVIDFWGPWLDDKHPNPAKPGELRWYTTIDGKDVERPNGEPFLHNGSLLTPLSRTFIPSRVTDNPFLAGTNYMAVLDALPEPLRSQMRDGDFKAGIQDSEWQVCPTKWVDAAMERWQELGKQGPMDSVGADIARGGSNKTVISTRYGNWYAPLIVYPGSQTPDGGSAAGLIVQARRDGAPVHVDTIGVGGSVVDHLKSNEIQVVPVNSAGEAPEGQFDKATGRLKFRNMRAYIWWRFRELLDPAFDHRIALPPDPELRSDLCAPHWTLTPGGILIEPKEDKLGADGIVISGIKKRLGRSPDKGEAVVYCSISTPKINPSNKNWRSKTKQGSWRV